MWTFRISIGKKGYKVLVLNTKKIIVSRDVVFHKNIFTFASSKSNDSYFPVYTLIPTTDSDDNIDTNQSIPSPSVITSTLPHASTIVDQVQPSVPSTITNQVQPHVHSTVIDQVHSPFPQTNNVSSLKRLT